MFAGNVGVKTTLQAPLSTQTPAEIPRGADLDVWVRHSWQEGMQVEELWAGDQLVVKTANTAYEVTVVSPRGREVVIYGGNFFPERTRVHLDGCSLRGAFLKLGGIYVGFSLELRGEGGVVVTSPVHSIGFVQHG
jgi:hypothetical protein